MGSWKNSICGLLLLVMGSVSGLANEIDATTAHLLAQNGKLTIIDIRRPAEWRETGMPDTSVGISLQNFLKKIRKQFPNDVFAALDGDQSRAVALICASGGRSAYAVGLLQEAGFVNVYDISGGMRGNGQAPGWMARNLPIVSCDGC